MTRSARPVFAWVGALLALALTLTACTATPQPSPTGSSSASATGIAPIKVLNVGATLEPITLDPSTTDGAAIPFVLLYNVYETLVKVDGDNKLQPLLAKSWDISDDRLTYVFHLADATFASGKPVDAAAVVASLQRVKDGANGVTDSLKAQMAPVASITATDDKTVTVVLAKPSNDWLFNMSQTTGIIYDPSRMDRLKNEPAGSGPYVFKEWRKGESITLARNEAYWDKPVNLRGAVFRYYSDANAMTTAMLAGQLDIVSNLTTPEAIGQFENNQRYRVLDGASNGEVVLGFNHSAEPMKKLQVRQAINYAIDRKALMDAAWGGKGTLIGSMVSPLVPWYEDLSKTYTYDPEKAKTLLKEAGYESGLKLRLRIPTVPYAKAAAPFIVSQLKSVGIEVALDEVEFPVWRDQIFKNADYDMTIVAHVEPRDMNRFAWPTYYWRYDNPTYQKLLADADAAGPEQETALLKQAAKLLADDAAADWLWLLPNLIITTSEVSGINKNATSLSFDITAVTVK